MEIRVERRKIIPLILPGFIVLFGCSGDDKPLEPSAVLPLNLTQPNTEKDEGSETNTEAKEKSAQIILRPGDDVASIIANHGEASSFRFTPGIYNNVTIVPRDGQRLIGDDGAVLSGAVAISGWRWQDGFWVAKGFPERKYSHGEGRDGLAQYREDLFVEGKPYLRAANRGSVKPGYFFEENGTVWISDNPTGQNTIASATSTAIDGQRTKDVHVENITIMYYASMAQHGAIEAPDTTGWTIKNVTARFNHGAGLRAGSGMKVLGGDYSNNGQIGIRAQDVSGLSLRDVTSTANNYAGFEKWWDAGGIKILTSKSVLIEGSCIAGNDGAGVWIDWDNSDVGISGNMVTQNREIGIQYEASRRGHIKGNFVAHNNASGTEVGYWGSDLLVQNSSNVIVSGNVVISHIGQGVGMVYDKRDPGRYGRHETRFNKIVNNTIIMLKGGKNGFAASADTNVMYDGSNKMDGNRYFAKSPDDLQFTWNDAWFTQPHIGSQPIEAKGTFQFLADPLQGVPAWTGKKCSVREPLDFLQER